MFCIQEEGKVKIIHTVVCRVFQQSLDAPFLFMAVFLTFAN
jgi:hypothetical protein